MQSYINSDSEEEHDNIVPEYNPLAIKRENYCKLKIIKYFIHNKILCENINCSICGLNMKLEKTRNILMYMLSDVDLNTRIMI